MFVKSWEWGAQVLPLLAGLSLILGRMKAGHCSVEWGGGRHRGPHLHTDLDLLCDPHLDLLSEPHLDPPYILVSQSIMYSDIWISCAPQHPGLLCGLDSRPTVCPDLCLWCLDQLCALAFRPTVCLSRLSLWWCGDIHQLLYPYSESLPLSRAC